MEAEPYYLEEDGVKRDDWIHGEMLDSPEGEVAADALAVKQAVAHGMSLKDAIRFYVTG